MFTVEEQSRHKVHFFFNSSVPTKQYQISTLTNKVYDITDRKKFCSSHCYKASTFLKDQMLTSPLWLRDQELIPDFKLLSLNQLWLKVLAFFKLKLFYFNIPLHNFKKRSNVFLWLPKSKRISKLYLHILRQ